MKDHILLGCPTLCPEYGLAAVRALMKPKSPKAIAHRHPVQKITAGMRRAIVGLALTFGERTGGPVEIHFPPAGDFKAATRLPGIRTDDARGLAVLLSLATPRLWWTVDRLFVLDGKFFRRERGYGLKLVPASNVSLSRPMRTLVRNLSHSEPVSHTSRRSVPREAR